MISLENVTLLDFFIPSNEFKSMTLDRFCVKRHFEIGLVNTLTAEDEPFLNDLISLSKIKEKITHVTFIEASKVENFIKSASSETKEYLFPQFLMEELKEFSQFHENLYSMDPEIIDEYEAYSIKFKLIQTMYEQFSDEMKEKKRRELLSKELTALADKRPIGSRGKKGNIESRSKQSTATHNKRKSRESHHEVEFMEPGIMENELIVDDDLKDQVYFYILKGYDNIVLVKQLLEMQVKISFIIQISEFEPDDQKIFNKIWKDIDIVRSLPSDYLQNIALMKYQPPPHDNTSPFLETYLKEIVDIIKSLIDLKRSHFNYVKELLLFDAKFTETFKVFPFYDYLMNNYPLETLTIPLIIDGILQEIQMKSDKNFKCPNKPTKTFSRGKQHCPFDFTSKVRHEKKIGTCPNYFKIYENDNLNLTFKSYKVGYQYMINTLRVLKFQLPVLLVKQCEFNTSIDDYSPHVHHVCVPSNNQSIFTNEQTDYLINLLYLKKSILQKFTQEDIESNEFTKNLIIHDVNKHEKNNLPEYVNERSWSIADSNIDSNVYEAIQPLSLHWAEILKPELLFQYLLDSQLRYLCSDYIICELTNSLMIRFHNDVDSLGLHTKVWNEYLRTPVGLADFCKFVLTDDYEWLKNHMPYPQVTYLDIVRMLEEQTCARLYNDISNEAYKHLLMPEIQYSSSDFRKHSYCPCVDENEHEKTETNRRKSSINKSELSSNLLEILHDLEEYKKLSDFSERCHHDRNQPYSFPAYSLGHTKFRIIGHTTNFISLDNVNVTVDSSRLSTESFNLTLKLLSDDNLFVLRTNQRKFNFHIVLADGTLIVFAKPSVIEEKPTGEDTSSSLLQIEESTNDVEQSVSFNSDLSHQSGDFKQGQEEKTLIAMDFNHYSSLELYPIVGSIIRETPEELYKRDLEKEMDILKRLQNMPNCIKVSRRGNLKHLEQIATEYSIPISSVVRRIINNPAKQLLCRLPKKKCIIIGELPPRKQNSTFDHTVTLPNGLTIKVQPSEILPNSSIVKQSYEYAEGPGVSEEKYRIFTSDGNIIIRKVDGTMKILTSSGKEVRFYKLSNSDGEEIHCKFHKKLDDRLIKKILARLMSNQPGQEDSDLYPSRRGHLHTKSKLVSNCPNLLEVSDLPFSVISMITVDGDRITLRHEKLSKVVHSRLMSEMNFLTEERRFKREDGFSSTTDREGSHHVVFPDGTSIKTSIHVREEVVRVEEKDKMGWILITAVFSFEHPSYKPVCFDNTNDIIKIRLNEHQSLNVKEDGASVDVKNSSWNIRTDSIDFVKKCERCKSEYKCKIDINPLFQNKIPDQDAYFVTAEDSYNKIFKSDFFGNCKVFTPFIKGVLNKNGCNHAMLNDHQRIYCIKKDLSGMLLWNDEKAKSLMKDTEENKIMHHSCDAKNNLLFVSITKSVSTNFNERFSGKIIREFEAIKQMLPAHRPVLYQITRNLYSMIEMAQIDDLAKCLRNFFKEEIEQELTKSVSALEFLKEYVNQSQSTSTNMSVEETKPQQSTVTIHEKIMGLNKKDAMVRKIMQSPIPDYFHSTCCTFIPPSISSDTSKLNQNL